MKIFGLLLTATLLLFSSEYKDYTAAFLKNKAAFEQSKYKQEQSFLEYKTREDEAYSLYIKKIEKFWAKPKLSTQKKWVSYSKDSKSRSLVDFEKNILEIQVIAPNLKEAQKLLQKRLSYVVSKNTQEVIQTDPLQKEIAKIEVDTNVVDAKIDSKPILSTVLFTKKPTQNQLIKYTEKTVKKSKISIKKSKFGDENIYKLTLSLPKDTTLKRSKVYEEEILKYAKKFNLPASLVFAITQTESDFNPFAKSHIPAFGLMQIVPHSAGRDAYFFLYKKKGKPSSTYLYNSKNNIEMGSSYLHILYYRYLKKIKNKESRLYCTIAAYNTGAGNIAWAFTRTHNMNKAAPKINAMSPREVYNHLLKNLRYDEPKHYLKRVTLRMGEYKRAYKL